MTNMDIFLHRTMETLQEHFNLFGVSHLEKLAIKVAVYGIFQKNFNCQNVYQELTEYFEDEVKMPEVLPEIQKNYINLT